MREILFRAKNNHGRWIYGSYFKHINRTPSPVGYGVKDEDIEHVIIQDEFSDWNMPRGIMGIHVDPETVGEWSGMIDKKGKKIFEGDIVLKRTYHGKTPERVVFSFGAFNCGFGGGSSTAAHMYLLNDNQIEVIGNVYDNPELLEGK